MPDINYFKFNKKTIIIICPKNSFQELKKIRSNRVFFIILSIRNNISSKFIKAFFKNYLITKIY